MSLQDLPVPGGKPTAEPIGPPPTAHALPKCPLLSGLLPPKDTYIKTIPPLPVFYFINKEIYVYFLSKIIIIIGNY